MSAFPCPAFLSPFLETQTRFLWETHCVQCLWVGSLSYFSHMGSDGGRWGGNPMSCSVNLLLPPVRNSEVPVSYSEAHSFGSAAWQLPAFACLSSSALGLRHRGQGFELRSSFIHSKMHLPIDSVPNSSSPFYLLPYSLRRNWIDALGLTSQRVCPAGHSDGGTGAK